MGKKCNIGYVDSSINPIRGCPGCELWTAETRVCYAGRLISRWAGKTPVWPAEFTKPALFPKDFEKSASWPALTGTDRDEKPWLNGSPRVVFVNDMSDTWSEFYYTGDGQKHNLPVDWIAPYMDMLTNSNHIYLWLTKRPRRAVRFFESYGEVPANFWVGTSVTSAHTLKRAIELSKLAPICNGKLWLSLEPLYGRINLTPFLGAFDWVVTGGESGANPTKSSIESLAAVVDDCQVKGVPVFVKQLGSGQGAGSKGENWQQWPPTLQVRQMPVLSGWAGKAAACQLKIS